MHLLRNCIDHGIEQPDVRQSKGKPACGTITVAIAQKDSGKIEIMVADDGAGIDADKVKAASRRLNLVSAEEAEKLNEQEAQALIFLSGISTSPIITDISGRGLGLAIVREKIERLGGVIALESRQGGGTTFRITLPLMLATFRGVLVRAGEHCFVIPALSVERVARVVQQDIRTVENRATISLDGQVVALASLGDVLELPRQSSTADTLAQVALVVLGTGRQRVAFQVEEILGEQEVLVKTLGRQLARVRNIAGASVLGTGQVVAVLNVPDLLKSAVKRMSAPPRIRCRRKTRGSNKAVDPGGGRLDHLEGAAQEHPGIGRLPGHYCGGWGGCLHHTQDRDVRSDRVGRGNAAHGRL